MPSQILLVTLALLGAAIAGAVILPLLDIAAMVRSAALRRRWYALCVMLASVVVLMLVVTATVRQTPNITAFATVGSYVLGAIFLMGVVLLARSTTRNALRVDELEEAVLTDPLTGLANRRCFDKRLSDEVFRAHAADLPLSLFVFDVDYFKRVNDVHGHGVGDLVLRQVASVVASMSRRSDTACRIGGEEFVVIVPGLEGTFAAATAERLRCGIGDTVTPGQGGGDVRVTVSLGLATLRPGDTASMLFFRADAALYEAKHGGRDRMAIAA